MQNQPQIGTPVYTHSHHGYIFDVTEKIGEQLFLICGGDEPLEKIKFEAHIVYLEDGKGHHTGTWENITLDNIVKEGEALATPDQLIEYLSQAKISANEKVKSFQQVRQQKADERLAYEQEHAKLIPVWASSAIVASFDEDRSDIQTDYFHSVVTKSVILGFSKHNRDLFPEMRKFCVNFDELAHLVEKSDSNEHREKYSMGSGYYLKDGGSNCTSWRVHKVILNENDKVKSLPMGEWMTAAPEVEKDMSEIQQGFGFQLSPGTRAGFIQIKFEEKPNVEIRNELKDAGFRWSRHNSVWYGRSENLPVRYHDVEDYDEEEAKIASSNAGVDHMRFLADSMNDAIDSKMNPATAGQNPTPRRAGIIESMRIDGQALQKVQHILNAIADGLENDTLPQILRGINNKAVIESVLTLIRFIEDERYNFVNLDEENIKRLQRVNINTHEEYNLAALAMRDLVEGAPKEDETVQKIRKAENDLIGLKIDGFFPTPDSVIDKMLDHCLHFNCHGSMLEPSAGNGAIAQRFKDAGYGVDVIEWSPTLQNILALKGFNLVDNDFLEFAEKDEYNLIVMNPPFEKCQDIDHILHAYDLLKSGGRLIAIAGEGVFFRSGQKETNFITWLDHKGADIVELDDAFKEKGAGRIRTTVARSRLIVIDKP